MALMTNIAAAEQAVRHVAARIPLGGVTQPIGEEEAKTSGCRPVTMEEITRQAGIVKATRIAMARPEQNGLSKLRFVASLAANAEMAGMGDRGQHACVAFEYLRYRLPQGLGLAFAAFGANHEFVILEPPSAFTDGSKHEVAANVTPAGWPEGAVICDPWYREVFGVYEYWSRKAPALLRLTEPRNTTSKVTIAILARMN